MAKFILALLLSAPLLSVADPLIAPGELRLWHDISTLVDTGVIEAPVTTWPLPWADIAYALDDSGQAAERAANGGPAAVLALHRIKSRLAWEMEAGARVTFAAAVGKEPRQIRTFQATPRADHEASLDFQWLTSRTFLKTRVVYSENPFDDDELFFDESYLGVALGNWVVSFGWQNRWWGPSTLGSLILSSNARPSPGVSIQRAVSLPFQSRALRWLGPWTLTTFVTQLDDDRAVKDARLFGIRGSFRPPGTGLEFALSRAAQWCGDGRPCNAEVFVDLLAGNDNRGVNVDPEQEPGNQLGGVDIRWTLPRRVPFALYMQWIGEDGRGGGGAIGSWLRQAGLEHWGGGSFADYRVQFEVTDTMCREGGFGFSARIPDCAYGHQIYESGYRYQGLPIGSSLDSDSLSYALSLTLVQSSGDTWNLLIRDMEINRDGAFNARHSLSPARRDQRDAQLTYDRVTRIGRFVAGVGHTDFPGHQSGGPGSEFQAFLSWSSR